MITVKKKKKRETKVQILALKQDAGFVSDAGTQGGKKFHRCGSGVGNSCCSQTGFSTSAPSQQSFA